MEKNSVLFLCTGNSARSQMAEAIVNYLLGEHWTAHSAGTAPSGFVHPLARKVLAEIGIEHRGSSKSVEEFKGQDFDVVIAVCDDAAENCPVWLGRGHTIQIGFQDPAKAEGSEAERMAAFRDVRDEIADRIPEVLTELAADPE